MLQTYVLNTMQAMAEHHRAMRAAEAAGQFAIPGASGASTVQSIGVSALT